jgi:hypothetical protein
MIMVQRLFIVCDVLTVLVKVQWHVGFGEGSLMGTDGITCTWMNLLPDVLIWRVS